MIRLSFYLVLFASLILPYHTSFSLTEDVLGDSLASRLLSLSGPDAMQERVLAVIKEKILKLNNDRGSSIPFDRMFDDLVDWKEIRRDMTKIFASEFSADELKEVIHFYESFAGQKMVQRSPLILQNLFESMKNRIETKLPRWMAEFDSTYQDSLTNRVAIDTTIDTGPYHTGIFSSSHGEEYLVLRDSAKQVEVIPALNLRNEYEINWRGRNEYDLVFLRSNNEKYEATHRGIVHKVLIVSATATTYSCIVSTKGRKNTATLYKVQ